jgi:hypothetical protein
MFLLVEQSLNGLQFGLLLFLLAAGLTLVFSIMDLVNLAHGSFYVLGASSLRPSRRSPEALCSAPCWHWPRPWWSEWRPS